MQGLQAEAVCLPMNGEEQGCERAVVASTESFRTEDCHPSHGFTLDLLSLESATSEGFIPPCDSRLFPCSLQPLLSCPALLPIPGTPFATSSPLGSEPRVRAGLLFHNICWTSPAGRTLPCGSGPLSPAGQRTVTVFATLAARSSVTSNKSLCLSGPLFAQL